MKTDTEFNSRSFLLAAAFLTGLGCSSDSISAQQIDSPYLIDLNSGTATYLSLLGGRFGDASGINDSGQVVGYSRTVEDTNLGFITGPNGTGIRALGTLGGESSFANDINNRGQVVGQSQTLDGNWHAFITGPNGTGMRDLGKLGGDFSSASAINDLGQVTGSSDTTQGYTHAFITGPDGAGMKDLVTSGRNYADAFAINDAGQVAGVLGTGEGFNHAFITGPDGAGMRDLGVLDRERNFSRAFGINNAGQVVGESETEEGHTHAFITGPDGVGMRDLGTLGGNYSSAAAINDAGQVVGWANTADGSIHAFITGPDGEGMTDINSLIDLPDGRVLIQPSDINNAASYWLRFDPCSSYSGTPNIHSPSCWPDPRRINHATQKKRRDSATCMSSRQEERQREGIALAKAKGVYKGRKPALNEERIAQLREQAAAGANQTKLAKDFGISRGTLYQYIP